MKTPLYEKILTYITEQIKAGQLKIGDRVPSEKELADQFSVSRITSKKALDLLAQNEIIERIRGKGSFVADAHTEKIERTKNIVTNIRADSKLIALIIPDFSDTYGLNLVKTIEKHCLQNNSHLIIRRTSGLIKEEENAINSLVNDGVDGLIIFPVHGEHYNVELLKLVLIDFPLVLIDRYLKGIPASSVCTDNQRASETLTKHLFELGHTEVAFISPSPIGTSTIEERIKGFHMAYSKQGIKLNPNLELTNLVSSLPQNVSKDDSKVLLSNDYQLMKRFILDNPTLTGFVVCEYELARILTKVINDLGKKIPEDYSIVCFDSPENRINQATFTHILQHEVDMGSEAVKLLMKQLKGEIIPKHTFIDYTLIEGKSTIVKSNL